MADRISTVVLSVDLDCNRCYKKISRAVCKLQEKVTVHAIVFNEKANTVTISGPFEPKRACKKLCCWACNAINDIEILGEKKVSFAPEKKVDKPKPADKPAKPKKVDKPKDAAPAEPKPDKSNDAKPADKPAEPKADKQAEAKADKPKDAKPADKPPEPKADKPKDAAEPKADKPAGAAEPKKNQADYPAMILTRAEPAWNQPVCTMPGCSCAGGQWYPGYYGDSRGCWCGRGGGYSGGWTPQPQVVYGAPVYCGGAYNGKPGTFFSEEDPQASCTVM